jgi:alpha-mannosidase II
MSFLSLWWDQATETQRTLLKKLISNQQFEIVTGGWVSEEKISRFDLIAFIR